MQCRYCREWNEADERRCVRCGRRLHLAAAQAAPPSYVTAGGAATAPAFEVLSGKDAGDRTIAVESPRSPSYQPSLFRDAANAPKVIPIPTLTPLHPREREESAQSAKTARAAQSQRRQRRPSEASGNSTAQQALDFYGRTKLPEMDTVIYCDAPVAMPAHRLIAAAFDASMVVIALGVFLIVFSIWVAISL
jgi:hypothetical protein